MGRINSTKVDFLNKAERLAMYIWDDKWPPTDSVALVAAIWPRNIVKTNRLGRVHAIVCGPKRGFVTFEQSAGASIESSTLR